MFEGSGHTLVSTYFSSRPGILGTRLHYILFYYTITNNRPTSTSASRDSPIFCDVGQLHIDIVDRGRWVGKPANFKYSEQRTHLEVEQGLTVHKVF